MWVLIGVLFCVVVVFLGSLLWRLIYPPIVPYVEQEGPRSVIQVTVTNSSGVSGTGRQMLDYLRTRGFDVVELRTGADTLDRSMVIDRLGDRISALKVARVLEIADTMVVSEIDSMMFVRASIYIGKDYTLLSPFQD